MERMIIEIGIRQGKSNRGIARSLGRSHSVINYEIKSHSRDRTWYRAVIAGRLKYHDAHLIGGKTISHESIYLFIYEGEGRYLRLYRHLKRAKNKRKKHKRRKTKNIAIPSRISIHQRPTDIDANIIPGHWESDSVEGKKSGSKQALSVPYERRYRITKIHRVLNVTAEETSIAIQKTIDCFPLHLIKSITFDNGKESAKHTDLRNDYGIDTYHCDPYAPWQKGGVENTNGLLRYYIPKGTDIANYTDDEIQYVEDILNNTPRKSLHYLSPYEALQKDWGGLI